MTVATELDSILARVRSLEQLVESRRDEFDAVRQMPGGISGELLERELYRLWTPRDLGGLQLDPPDALRVISELARLEGAVGWNTMIPAAYSMLAGHMEREAAEHVYGPADAVVAGQLQPGGKATLNGETFEVTGRWSFGSAGSEANWLLGQCILEGEGVPEPSIPGMPPMRLLFAPASECEIHDTWDTSGLRGTGSNDYSMSGVRVRRDHSADLFSKRPMNASALYRMPVLPSFIAMVAAVPIGIARTAVEVATDLMTTKRLFPTGELYSERETVKAGIARAENLVGAAEALLMQRVSDVWSVVQAGGQPTSRQRALMRAAAAHSGESCCEAVSLVCELAGTTAIFKSNRLERCRRDVQTARAHVAVSPNGLVEAGTALYGGFAPTV